MKCDYWKMSGISLYKKIATLGKGKNCEVGCYVNLCNDNHVVIKTQLLGCVQSIKKEIEVLKFLCSSSRCPNIVEYIDDFHEPTIPKDYVRSYLLMSPCLGGPLHLQIKNNDRHLSVYVIRYYSIQLISALAFLYNRNCIHRDMKADNCALDTNGNLKLIDFGQAKIIEANTRCYSLVGSENFISPEVVIASLETGYGFSVDWWSLGVLIYEMMTGDSPGWDRDDYCRLTATNQNNFDPKNHSHLDSTSKQNQTVSTEDMIHTVAQSFTNSLLSSAQNNEPKSSETRSTFLCNSQFALDTQETMNCFKSFQPDKLQDGIYSKTESFWTQLNNDSILDVVGAVRKRGLIHWNIDYIFSRNSTDSTSKVVDEHSYHLQNLVRSLLVIAPQFRLCPGNALFPDIDCLLSSLKEHPFFIGEPHWSDIAENKLKLTYPDWDARWGWTEVISTKSDLNVQTDEISEADQLLFVNY